MNHSEHREKFFASVAVAADICVCLNEAIYGVCHCEFARGKRNNLSTVIMSFAEQSVIISDGVEA